MRLKSNQMKKIVILLLLATGSVFAQTDVVKFKAAIANRNSDTLKIYGQKGLIRTIALKDGKFSDSFSVTPSLYQISDGTENTLVFLQNGFDLDLKMDAKMFDESIVFTGNGEKENNFLAQKALYDEQFEEKMAGFKTADDFKIGLRERTTSLSKQLEDPKMDANFKMMANQMVQGESAQMNGMYEAAQAKSKVVGMVSPQFDYENHKGGKTKLSDLKGKYVYIDNWATWCGPCLRELPALKMVEEKYHGKNIEFVSVSIDTKKDYEKWKNMVTNKKLGGIQVIADNDWNSEFIKAFGINSIPRFLLIGPDGKVIDADAKRPSDPALIAELDALLK